MSFLITKPYQYQTFNWDVTDLEDSQSLQILPCSKIEWDGLFLMLTPIYETMVNMTIVARVTAEFEIGSGRPDAVGLSPLGLSGDPHFGIRVPDKDRFFEMYERFQQMLKLLKDP